MADDPDGDALKALEKRIAQVKAGPASKKNGQDHHAMAQQGWRMVIELVSGLGIGFCLGYGLDVLLGTMPIFLVVMTLAGFAAGVKTMIRTSKELQDETLADISVKDKGE
jgi:ATP synthase protein I